MTVRVEWQTDSVLTAQVLHRDGALLAYLAGHERAYDDPGGADASVYRVYGEPGYDSGPFQPTVNRAADLQTRFRLDHTYDDGRLRYTDDGGNGVRVTVRVYREADWEAGRIELAIAVVETNTDGTWRAPVFLEPGMNYILHVQGEGRGPIVETLTI